MKKYEEELEFNQRQLSLEEFLEFYNQNIPDNFPSVSAKNLKKFRDSYPALFRKGNFWSIALHRKKIIDWLPGHCNDA